MTNFNSTIRKQTTTLHDCIIEKSSKIEKIISEIKLICSDILLD